ncbi:dihydrolipoyl dehydrogenase [Acuticoccus yangtzensis]|uniref:dihydrolipoyl dehydrogenase n=1 Tax=Acuticoccus yangtzensis TaxID=1443441 RepID=UPI0009499D06|nr:dihydrolipoyl dehydrogenase [Acuticoccus yangtzensis]
MTERIVDVAIIGAGTAGLAAYKAARASTENVLLIERGAYGTTCARVGCMPSKLLIAAANAAEAVRVAPEFGIHASLPDIDGAAVMERVRRMRDSFVAAILEDVANLPAQTKLRGHARFEGADALVVDGPEGRTRVRAKRIVIATGSEPLVPDTFKTVRPDTSDTLFEWTRLPSSAAVFGNGIIGLELGQALARLGVRVRLFGKDGLVGPLTDPAVLGAARDTMGERLDFVPHYELAALRGKGTGITVDYADGERAYSGTFERVLVAIGRTPNVAGLDLSTTGLELGEGGVPSFDRTTGRCGDSPIFIAGDAMNDAPLLHEASATGRLAGRRAADDTAPSAERTVPFSVVYCEPQIAMVGETFRELEERKAAFVTGKVDWAAQGRARIMGEAAGTLSLYADGSTGRILGAEMIGPRAEHIGHHLALAMTARLGVTEMLRAPLYHPTFEEGLGTALEDAASQLSGERLAAE